MTTATSDPARLPLSVIMPVGKRHAADLAALYAEYKVGLASLDVPYEFIVVLDGPRPEVAATLQRADRGVKRVGHVGRGRRPGHADVHAW